MNRGFAVFLILALISVILSFVIPDNSKRGFTHALSSYMIADEENKLTYDDTRAVSYTHLDVYKRQA